ncbi:hypothetical protein [Demequina salsinemoris]|uniref:hypothetical protein n=1 Tax=Demequina salsinemoris TaxID=577470 RepID=UPI00128AF154|nr:hypothetical protein [Demequina salsinemoris]
MPYLAPGAIFTKQEYDDGVMFAGALSLLSGELPYHDFVYLHPPGSLLWLTPWASLADVWGEPVAFATTRVLGALTAVGSTVLIALLLRRFGAPAMIVGSGLYAIWPAAVDTEQKYMLEPVLNLLLLAALLLMSRGTRRAALSAGMLVGLALSVKYWAILDVALLAGMAYARLGWHGAWRFITGAAAAAGVVALPFFIAAPTQMWEQTVVTQLLRPDEGRSFVTRMEFFATADASLSWFVAGLVFAVFTLLALLPGIRALVRRTPAATWDDPVFWGLLAITHLIAVLLSNTFYYHYATWVIAPLSLSIGHAVGLIRRQPLQIALATAAALVAMLAVAKSALSIESSDLRPAEIAAWSSTRSCVWGYPTELIQADAVRKNIQNGCAFDVDPLGFWLVSIAGSDPEAVDFRTPADLERIAQQIESADGVIQYDRETIPDGFSIASDSAGVLLLNRDGT